MKTNIKGALTTAVPVVGGAIAAKLAKNVSGKFVANPKIRAALPLILGMFLSTQSNAMMKHVGYGMIAVGGADLAGEFVPTLKGIEDMDLSGIFGSNVLNANVINDDDDLADELNDDVVSDDMSGEDYG